MTFSGGLLALLDEPALVRSDTTVLAFPVGPQVDPLESIWQTRQPLDHKRWKYIVIHHSGTLHGSAETLAAHHRELGFRGLGYQFVIGNGRGAADGSLYVGYRWLDQLPGVHTGGQYGDFYNRHAIGICLIGDGDRRPFTEAQMQRLTDLVRMLQREFDIPEDHVLLHRNVALTSDPGRYFSEADFRQRLQDF